MKTQAEIRRHRAALLDALVQPCGCAGTVHEARCELGRVAMVATVRVLTWTLGESTAADEARIDRMIRTVEADRAARG